MATPDLPVLHVLAHAYAVPVAEVAELPWWIQRLMVDVLVGR